MTSRSGEAPRGPRVAVDATPWPGGQGVAVGGGGPLAVDVPDSDVGRRGDGARRVPAGPPDSAARAPAPAVPGAGSQMGWAGGSLRPSPVPEGRPAFPARTPSRGGGGCSRPSPPRVITTTVATNRGGGWGGIITSRDAGTRPYSAGPFLRACAQSLCAALAAIRLAAKREREREREKERESTCATAAKTQNPPPLDLDVAVLGEGGGGAPGRGGGA